jgi:hypothetical protein
LDCLADKNDCKKYLKISLSGYKKSITLKIPFESQKQVKRQIKNTRKPQGSRKRWSEILESSW